MTDPMPVHFLVLALFAGLMCLAAATDADRLRIPNRVVMALVLLYPIYVLASPAPVDWIGGLIAAVAALAAGVLAWSLGKLGAGDAKLLAAGMLWAGPAGAPMLLLAMAIVGGGLALVLATDLRFVAAGAARRLFGGSGEVFLRNEIPYGVAIAAGAVAAMATQPTVA